MIRVVGRERGTGGKGGEWNGMGKGKGGKGSGDSSSFGGPHPRGSQISKRVTVVQ